MKIKSKFRDYYDGAAQMHLEEPLWIRNSTEINASDIRYRTFKAMSGAADLDAVLEHQDLHRGQYKLQYEGHLLFCGKLYTAIVRNGWDVDAAGQKVYKKHMNIWWKWNLELTNWLCQELRMTGWQMDREDDKLHEMFTLSGKLYPELYELQQEARMPIVWLEYASWHPNIVLNPRLASLGFGKMVSANQAWQELSMFWGNVIMPERNTVTISDKDRHAQHGFDKHSFRRQSKDLRPDNGISELGPLSDAIREFGKQRRGEK